VNATRKLLPTGLLLLAPCLGGWSSCEGSLNQDPSFDLWCGQRLCAWELEAGEVRRISTWHAQDAGVELVGDPAAISQRIETSSREVKCLRFEMLTDLDPDAAITLELDFQDDGLVEASYPVPATRWAGVEFSLRAPTWFERVRLRLSKTGPGRARLAHVRLSSPSQCSGEPLRLVGRPLGALCQQDMECTQARCTPGPFPYGWREGVPSMTCGTCQDSLDCPAGEVCGVEPSPAGLYQGCGPAGRHGLGERCREDDECTTGVCCAEMCSTCCQGGASCPAGRSCERAVYEPALPAFTWIGMPFQCDPGRGRGEPGEACRVDGDCAAGRCLGAGSLRGCVLDNHPCDSDADCPLGGATDDSPACLAVGARAGVCQ
jgi:hypothetical protein